MTAHTVAVVKYTYHLFSSREDEDPVVIFLYDEKSDVVGEVFFVAEDKVRNDGPITLRWAGPFDTSLSTEYEPIGEGEGGRKRRRRQP